MTSLSVTEQVLFAPALYLVDKKTPIAPGAKGTVNVTFDAKALGHFQKSVAIYSNAQPNLVYLKFNGEVVQEIKDFTKTHPYLIGQIRIDKNSLDFPDIQHGEQPVIHIGVVNLPTVLMNRY